MDGDVAFPVQTICWVNASPVARWIIAGIVLVSGIAWARSEPGTSVRKLAALAFAGAAALGATATMTSFFGA